MSSRIRKTPTEEMSPPSNSGIWHFFSNPIVGFIGTLASIISIPLAIYLFVESNVTRELCYLVNPARAVVVHAGQTSRLTVTLDGAPVKHDISAAQVAFWNEGRASIKPENVLQQLVIKTSPATPIIDATIRKRSREVVKIELDRSRLASGELTVHWNILEYQDGGVIQLIYQGDVNTPVVARAIVEGQGNLSDIRYKKSTQRTTILFLVVAATSILSQLIEKKSRKASIFLTFLSAILSLLFFAGNYLISGDVGPPFGF